MAQVATTNVRQIRDAQRKEWQKEWPFTVELLPLDALAVDDRYQREQIVPFIEAAAMSFDPTLVGTLDIAERTSGEHVILDGQQRAEICRRVDKRAVWCSIYRGMTVTGEAEFFVRKNRDRRNMHPFYALRARKVAGEKGPKEIFRTVEDLGFKLSSNNTRRLPEIIVAIGATEEVHAMTPLVRPEGSLQPALATLHEAFYGREGANEGTIIRGLGRFWQAYGDDEVDYKHLVEVLQEFGPKKLVGYAHDRVQTSRYPKAYLVAQEVVKACNKAQRRERRLSEQFLNRAENQKLRERRARSK